jgi:hypothetical protein
MLINGVVEGTQTTDVSGRSATMTLENFGNTNKYDTRGLQGDLSQLVTFRRALSDGEIIRQSQQVTPLPGAWASWPLFDHIGSSYLDGLVGSALTTDSTTTTSTDGPGVAYAPQQPMIVEPAAATNVDVTPGTGSLTTSLFAPTVVATDHISVTPTTGSLTTALFEPTVVATDHISVTPATFALTATLFVPTVSAGVDVVVTPGTGAFTTALFAPDVVASTNITLTPGVVGLKTAMWAPQFGGTVDLYPNSGSGGLIPRVPGVSISQGGVSRACGVWSTSPVVIGECWEWALTLEAVDPAHVAANPKVRVQLLFIKP